MELLKDFTKEISDFKSSLKVKTKKKKNKKRKFKKKIVLIRSYRLYMQSRLWKKRKNRYFNEHGKSCKACGGRIAVTLHHKFYGGVYGNEPDSDVVALCGICHKELHKHFGVHKDMREITEIFVREVSENRHILEEAKKNVEFFKYL